MPATDTGPRRFAAKTMVGNPNVPVKIGKYDVVNVIGRGGMGIVYKAIDPHLDRPVAIKMVTSGFADHPEHLKRFFREAQSLGSLQHPNIVTVYDLGDYGGNPYFVMQYLEGETLDSVLLNRRPLVLLDKINIMIQVCQGLSYAHRRGVVHRDIKPANIMLSKDGGVKILDFGIAYVGDRSVTTTGQIVGTLSYMSPEQISGNPVDARTDLFSVGVVLYQLFTGHLPFEGETTATTLLKILHDPPPPLGKFLVSYPPELEHILLRALAKATADRYGSAEEFALDLGRLQGQLKQESISQEMRQVAILLESGELDKAQESLLRVLKIDQHQTDANRLLREVQQRIKKDEISGQGRAPQNEAEVASGREAILETIEKQLAEFLGPLAKIVVKRAASQTTDRDELYAIAARSLNREEDRHRFLMTKRALGGDQTKPQSLREPAPAESSTMSEGRPSAPEITPVAIERAARLLAPYVGPISAVITKKAARHADSLGTFYLLLAEYVQDATERQRFLRDAGFLDT